MSAAKTKKTSAAPIQGLLTLTREKVRLDQLYLDPRNPRFGGGSKLLDDRIPEKQVQEAARRKIEEIGIEDLIPSIRNHGFVPTDPIVVREFETGKFVALEGNRRVATLKRLSASHADGEVSLEDDVLKSIHDLEVLVYKGKDPNIAWIVQGLRHMSGIKQWRPLQQATFVSKIADEMRADAKRKGALEPGLPLIAKAAGVAVPAANRLLRSHDAFLQAKDDDEFGQKFEGAEKFAMFAEAVFKSDSLQSWLGWDDKMRRFKEKENFKKFLSWVVEPEGGGEPKVPRALDMRDVVSEIVVKPELLRQFERGTLDINQARIEIDRNRPINEPDLKSLKSRLAECNSLIETLPMPKIDREKQWPEFGELLKQIFDSVNYHLQSKGKSH